MSTQATDGELVRQAQAGEQAAFAELYDRWFPRVYDFVLRRTRNRDDAADIVQETFMRAMQRLDQLREPEAFRGWLFAIARSQTLNRIEQRGRTAAVAALPDEDQAEVSNPLLSVVETDSSLDPSTAEEMQETAALVWEAAASLDERTYTVLDLHVRHGLQSAEIAEALGTSKQTASMLINRMRSRVGAAVGTYLLMRKGSKSCHDLDQIVKRCEIPPVTRSDRRRVDRHVRGCEICPNTKRNLVAPHQMFSAIALVAAPAGLQAGIRAKLGEAWPDATPPPPGTPPPRTGLLRPRVLAGLAATVVATAALIFAVTQLRGSDSDESAITTTEPEMTATATDSPPTTLEPTATPTEATTRPTETPTEATPTTVADPTEAATEEAPTPLASTQPPGGTPPPPTAVPTTNAAPPTQAPSAPPTPQPTPIAEPPPPPPPTEPPLLVPVIVSFSANPSPATCEGPFIELSWTTQNATMVTVSIDGPGIYDSYGPNGSAQVPFACTEASHTYLLTASGPDGSAEQTITVFRA